MAKTSVINIRTEAETKQAVEQLFSQFGITTSDAVNLFFHQALMYGGLPFEVKIPQYNAETLAAMQEAKEISKSGKSFDNPDEMFRELGI